MYTPSLYHLEHNQGTKYLIAGWGKALEIPNEHDFYLNYIYCHTRKCHLNFVKCMIMWQCGNFYKNLFFKASKNSKILRKLEVKYIRNKTCQKIEIESGSDFVIKGGLIYEVRIFILAPSSKKRVNSLSQIFEPISRVKDYWLCQLWIVKYFIKNSSNNLSNENINSSVFRETIFQK